MSTNVSVPITVTPVAVTLESGMVSEEEILEVVAGPLSQKLSADPNVTQLTGGGSTALDGVATEDLTVGVLSAATPNGSILTHIYKLEAGTLAEDSPDVIRPDDYAASTNEKVWRLISFRALSITGGTLIVAKSDTELGFIQGANLTGSRSFQLPDESGTVALTSDIKPTLVKTSTPTTGFDIYSELDGNILSHADGTFYLTPASTLATGTFRLPWHADARVGQVIVLFSTEDVTSISVVALDGLDGEGPGEIKGDALTSLSANTAYSWQCVSTADSGTWIRLS